MSTKKRKQSETNSDATTSSKSIDKRSRKSEDQSDLGTVQSTGMPSALLRLGFHLLRRILFFAAPRVLRLYFRNEKSSQSALTQNPSQMSVSELCEALRQRQKSTNGSRNQLEKRLNKIIQADQTAWSGFVSYGYAFAAAHSPDPQEQKRWCRALELVIRPLTRSLGPLKILPELHLSLPDAVAFNWYHLCYRNPLTIMNEFKKESKSKTWVSLAATTCGLEKWMQWKGQKRSYKCAIIKRNTLRISNRWYSPFGIRCKEPLPCTGKHRWAMVVSGGTIKTIVGLITESRIEVRRGTQLNAHPCFHGVSSDNRQYAHIPADKLRSDGSVFSIWNDVLCFEADMDADTLKIWRGNVFLVQIKLPKNKKWYIVGLQIHSQRVHQLVPVGFSYIHITGCM